MSKTTTAAERAAQQLDAEWRLNRDPARHVRISEAAKVIAKEYEPMIRALEQLAECDLNDDNCASLEVATKRIRNIARGALDKAKV